MEWSRHLANDTNITLLKMKKITAKIYGLLKLKLISEFSSNKLLSLCTTAIGIVYFSKICGSVSVAFTAVSADTYIGPTSAMNCK